MEGDAHQQPCTICEQPQDPLHLEQEERESHAETTPLSDLPPSCLWLLLAQLEPWDRRALFRTCTGVAAAVVQHASRLTLKPDKALQQDSSRRTFVLKLAANSNNIWLHTLGSAIPLDAPDIWPCIKQLTLCNVGLTADTISTLHLQQLKHLHTIFFKERKHLTLLGAVCSMEVDAAAVESLMQADGLPALCTLNCVEVTGSEQRRLLQQLGPVMGPRVTELVVGSAMALKAIDKWPALRKVTLREPMGLQQPTTTSHAAIKQLLVHQQLQEVAVPSSMFNAGSSSAFLRAGKFQVLELTDSTGPRVEALFAIPLRAVEHLRMRTGIHTVEDIPSATVLHLRQCQKVEFVPGSWGNFRKRYDFDSIARPHGTYHSPQFCLAGHCLFSTRQRVRLFCPVRVKGIQ